MFKKVILLLVLFCVCSCSVAFANDAGVIKDDNVYFKIYPESNKIQLGEDFRFKIVASNKTDYDVGIRYFDQIFEYIYQSYQDDFGRDDDIIIIPAHKSIELNCKVTVPFNIYLYEENGKYYTYTDVDLQYYGIYPDSELSVSGIRSEPDNYDYDGDFGKVWYYPGWEHHNYSANYVKLEVTNLKNGSDYLDMEINSDSFITRYKNIDDFGCFYYSSKYNSEILLCNNTGNRYEIVSVNRYVFSDKYIEPNKQIDVTFTKDYSDKVQLRPFYSINNYDVSTEVINKVVFKVNSEYFCLIDKKSIPLTYYDPDMIEIQYELGEIPESFQEVTVSIKNVSDIELFNVFFSTNPPINEYNNFSSFINTIPSLRPNETYTLKANFTLRGSNSSNYVTYIYGWQIFDELLCYKESLYLKNNEKWVADVNIYPTATPSPLVTPTPITSPTPSPINDIITPTMFPAPDTPRPETIVIENVKVKGYFPLWVWIILFLSIIVTLTLIILLRKKTKE